MSGVNKDDVISAMGGIVGKKFVNGELFLTDNYAYNWNADNLTKGESKFVYRPLCVVLPSDTGEIVKIVKYCNEKGVQFKAQSTGWGVHNSVGKEDGVIILDCRRMDKILSIDTKNMIVVVEPYISGAMLQTWIKLSHSRLWIKWISISHGYKHDRARVDRDFYWFFQ